MESSKNRTVNFFRKHWLLLINGVFGLILLLVFLTPLLSAWGSILSPFLYLLFKPSCHQESVRSYFLFGKQLPVCARCTGIYLGMVLGGYFYALFRKKISRVLPFWVFLLMVLPMSIDGSGQALKLWNTGNLWRTVNGMICALGVVFYIYPYVDQEIRE
ncbi:DUF2085 domain-containing protein [bacterium]|nr:DUF2085 domain-containing protein [bacterium]